MIRTSETTKTAGPAFRAAQANFGRVVKNRDNAHFRSKYADLEAFYDAIRPTLNEHGFSIMHGSHQSGGQLTVVTRLQHDSGEWFETEVTMTPAQNTPQAVGSAVSYGKRYGIGMICGVAAEDDDDGESAEGRGKSNGDDLTRDLKASIAVKKQQNANIQNAARELGGTVEQTEILAQAKKTAAANGVTIPGGKEKGKPLSEASENSLIYWRDRCAEGLNDPKFGERNARIMTAIEAELSQRGVQ